MEKTKEIGIGQIATVVGRYYAMDRDKRWDRVEVALKGMVLGDGEESSDPVKTVKERYEKGENDEFLKPIIVGGKEARIKGKPASHMAGESPLTNKLQMVITFSSSTTDLTESEKSHNCSVELTDLQSRTFPIPKILPSPP